MLCNLYICTILLLNFNLFFAGESPSEAAKLAVLREARQHIPSHVATCQTLPELRKALDQETDEMLKHIQTQCAMSEDQWLQEYTKRFEQVKTYVSGEIKKMSPAKQDVDVLGNACVRELRKQLTLVGLDPNKVTIEHDKEFLIRFPHALAIAGYHDCRPFIKIDSSNSNFREPDRCILLSMHEAVHLGEYHAFQRGILREIFALRISTEDSENLLTQMGRQQEKRATLLPHITTLDNSLVNREIITCTIGAIEEGNQGISWGSSAPKATHPSCRVLLPYLIKINELHAMA
jgi:hypothetical protein